MKYWRITKMLQVDDLVVCYGSVTALSGISLMIQEGELIAVVGANGAGKSSLLNAIAGVVPVARGIINLLGVNINRVSPEARARRGISLVPEDRGIFRRMTVAENLRLATAAGRTANIRDAYERVITLFPILGEYWTKPAYQLSGGEQQMLSIGRAIVANPVLLLLDEPSLGLAPIVVSHLFEAIRQLNRGGVTVVLVEQHARKAIELAHRTYVIRTGRIALTGTSGQLLRNRSVIDMYLGTMTSARAAN
jgi:branched-chain amino acid transport system ATP-binding protein